MPSDVSLCTLADYSNTDQISKCNSFNKEDPATAIKRNPGESLVLNMRYKGLDRSNELSVYLGKSRKVYLSVSFTSSGDYSNYKCDDCLSEDLDVSLVAEDRVFGFTKHGVYQKFVSSTAMVNHLATYIRLLAESFDNRVTGVMRVIRFVCEGKSVFRALPGLIQRVVEKTDKFGKEINLVSKIVAGGRTTAP